MVNIFHEKFSKNTILIKLSNLYLLKFISILSFYKGKQLGKLKKSTS